MQRNKIAIVSSLFMYSIMAARYGAEENEERPAQFNVKST
jgi:hypothetical protein